VTKRATGGIVPVGQPVVVGEHGCSLRMQPRARLPITGSFRVERSADALAALDALGEPIYTDEHE
jgi:hypothetical protein